MKLHYIKFLLLAALFVCNTGAQAQQKLSDIKGLWKCYSSLTDTLNTGAEGLWIAFDETTMQTFLSAGFTLPEPVGDKLYYQFKKGILKTQQKEKTISVKITVYHNNLISYSVPMDGKSETVYLKRETQGR